MSQAIVCAGLGKSFPLGKREPIEVLKHQLVGRRPEYREPFWALKDVSFSVDRGTSLGVVGRNGSGKSTLLQVLTGVLPATEGEISVSGKVAALLELGSGFDPEYTGRENVFMNGAVLGLSRRQIEQRFEDIERFADIGRFIDEPVRVYSSGMFVRLAFSVAINVDADILIVDEALSVGDARFAAKCMRKIKQLREDGTTLLFVSHDVSSVRALCDQAIWLADGRVRQGGGVFEVTSQYMEYLFADEISSSDASTPELESPAIDANPAPNQDVDEFHDHASGPPPQTDQLATEGSKEGSGAVNHWGSHIGSITGHAIISESGRKHVYRYGEQLRLQVDVRVPEGVVKEHLSLAFSVKDLRGTDLLVCTTHDEHKGVFTAVDGQVRVTFKFVNRLTPGKYLLVLALEDRSAPVVSYYEYIEGAAYFACSSEETRFGIFNLPVDLVVEEIE